MLDTLNTAQREAVTHGRGPLLILAGAGSGKTRVITHRIAYLITECDIEPAAIAAVTFTNRAADEMRGRVRTLLDEADRGEDAAAMTLSTFHSLGARILRRHASRLELDRDFNILDQDDQTDLLREVLERTGRLADRDQRRSWQRYIEQAKHQGRTPEQARMAAETSDERMRAGIYEDYQRHARAFNAVDFGDLLLGPLELMRGDASLARRWGERWRHLMVDEFQDTNPAQYELLQYLTTAHRNLAVVGDDDQSIYRWRGADVGNILDFEDDFPDAEVVRMERNYRSTQRILDAAGRLIDHNPERRDKELWTDREDDEPIVCFTARMPRGEAGFVADEIQQLLEAGLEPDDVAIFYRTNRQSRVLEEACRDRGIPCRLVGDRSFYERREIKDVLAYLRLALGPEDDVGFLRVVGVPPRGVGDATVDKLREAAEVPGLDSLFDAARYAVGATDPVAGLDALEPHPASETDESALETVASLGNGPTEGLEAFVEVIVDLRDALRESTAPAELARQLVERLDYPQYLETRDGETSEERRRNLKELMAAMRAFERDEADEEHAAAEGDGSDVSGLDDTDAAERLRDFLARSALDDGSADRVEGAEPSGVTLTTVHGAKGLEFDTVFVVGLEEGLFPLVDATDDPAELYEERRLAYVAVTRAERKLYVTNALERRRRGERVRTAPSRFVAELGDEHLERHPESRADSIHDWGEEGESVWDDGWERHRYSSGSLADKRADASPLSEDGSSVSNDETEEPDGLVGRRVSHPKFGEGTVDAVVEGGGRTKVTVDFPEFGEQTIVRSFVEVVDE